MNRAILFLVAAAAAAQSPPDSIFRTGTRLVEVEVVVRDQRIPPPGVGEWFKWALDSGPPFGPPGVAHKGLMKDDFTLFDEGKPQPLAVFSIGPSGDTRTLAVPPGAVSNRTDNLGQPLHGATAVLIDLLNTPFDLTDYARLGLTEFLRSLSETDTGIALYSLGENLHVLHDFADDPQTLRGVAAELEQPHGRVPPNIGSALRDYGDLMAREGGGPAAAEVHGQITVKAVKRIVQRLSGVSGRKSLVWVTGLSRLPPTVMAMLQRANIVLYPVAVRGGGLAALEGEDATQAGTASGGRGFFDAMDLTFAVQTAEEDSSIAYVLGYYPPENMLDGKFHKITVKLNPAKVDNKTAEIHYRSGYLATKAAVPAPAPSLAELFEDPADSARIGLVAQATPEARHPGLYDVRLTVDLHDIRLDLKDGHFTGGLDFSVPNPSSKGTVKTGAFAVDLKAEQLAEALESGFTLVVRGVEPESGEIRVVVRDRATGIAGSLRVPAAKQ